MHSPRMRFIHRRLVLSVLTALALTATGTNAQKKVKVWKR